MLRILAQLGSRLGMAGAGTLAGLRRVLHTAQHQGNPVAAARHSPLAAVPHSPLAADKLLGPEEGSRSPAAAGRDGA